MRRASAVVFSAVLVAVPLAGQAGSLRKSIPSPAAASLGKFGDVPVSLYNGLPEISIPLFTVQGRTVELPITLRYHAGGIKVEEIGSWAGIGWAVEAGGTITRSVHGLVDESTSGFLNTGYQLYDTYGNPSNALLDNIRTEQVDAEPDQFFFDFAGRSGQFVMGPTSGASNSREFRTIPHQDLKIEPIGTFPITGWIITAEDGTKYTFGQAEYNTDQTLIGTTFGGHYGEQYTSSWHLTEIRSPGGDVITLTYAPYTATHRMAPYYEKFDQVTSTQNPACRGAYVDTRNEFIISSWRLATITSAKHTVTFAQDPTLRSDALSPSGAAQEPRLATITIATAATPPVTLRVFRFEHDYSTGRLTLRNVYEQDRNNVSLPPYSFTYDPTPLPDRFSYDVDHWGFYNAAGNGTYGYIPPGTGFDGVAFDGSDRNPNPTTMKAGSLRRITYPTGGYNELTFEANDYGSVSGSQPMGTASHSQTLYSYEAESATFTIGGTQSVIVEVITAASPECGDPPPINPPCPQAWIDGVAAGGTNSTHTFVTLAPGTYTMHADDYGTYPNGFAQIEVRWDQPVPIGSKLGGGLRVAQIDAFDPVSNTTTTHKYDYTLQSDPTRSSGVISSEPQYEYTYEAPDCRFVSRSSMPRMPLGDGPVVGYTQVTELLGAAGQFGKTRSNFRSVLNVGDPPSATFPYLRHTSYEWQRGQDTAVQLYTSAGVIQRRTASSYTFRNDVVGARLYHGIALYSLRTLAGGEYFVGINFYNPFDVISEWVYVESDTTVVYDEAGANPLPSTRSYLFENPGHLQLTQSTETNSNGVQRLTKMRYPGDYTAGTDAESAALAGMRANHIDSPVIERWVIEKNGGTQRVVQGELTTWREFATGQFLPYQHFVLNSPSALP